MKLAYILTDRPQERDATLHALAALLAADGLDTAGAIQIDRGAAETASCEMDLLLLPDGPVVRISQSLGPGASGCKLDTDRLERTVAAACDRLAAGAAVAIVNKFGKQEAGGRGFCQLIVAAADRGVPVVVGLAPGLLAEFRAFAGDLATCLPCDPATLAAWCRTPAE